MSDLLKRLDEAYCSERLVDLCDEAAARIKELEAELEKAHTLSRVVHPDLIDGILTKTHIIAPKDLLDECERINEDQAARIRELEAKVAELEEWKKAEIAARYEEDAGVDI